MKKMKIVSSRTLFTGTGQTDRHTFAFLALLSVPNKHMHLLSSCRRQNRNQLDLGEKDEDSVIDTNLCRKVIQTDIVTL